MNKELDILLPEFSGVVGVNQITDGSVSLVYKVEDRNGPMLVKGYPTWFNIDDINYIHEFTENLQNLGFVAPSPRPLSNGHSYVVGDKRIFSIFDWVHFDAELPSIKEQIKLVGSTIACIHNASVRPSIVRSWWTIDNYKAEKYFSEAQELLDERSDCSTQQQQLASLEESWQWVKKNVLDSGNFHRHDRMVVHGDIQPKNVGYQDGLLVLFDPDNCHEEVPEMDLVKPLLYYCGFPTLAQWPERSSWLFKEYLESSNYRIDPEILIACIIASCVQEGSFQIRSYLARRNSMNLYELNNQIILLRSFTAMAVDKLRIILKRSEP